MLKAYKYRIYPNKEQQAKINQTISVCRLVYNLALETKIAAHKTNGTRLSAIDLCYQLAEMKADYSWMREVDSQALQASIKKLDKAFQMFFMGNRFPKFKTKTGRQSFQCPNNKRQIDFQKQLLTIPKIPEIKIAISRTFYGKIKTVTISRTPTGKYFASILVDNEQDLPPKKPVEETTAIGIDLGIKDFAILSDGSKVPNPNCLKKNIQRLKVLQRRASRKKKCSSNRKKASKKVALQHERIANMRKDFLHKTSTAIAKQYDTLCFENLRIKNMVKNHNLAQAISDCAWGSFVVFCKYKMEWKGGNTFELPKFQKSTKPCSTCGEVNDTLTIADRDWTCASCGSFHDRDINAALNIKQYFFKKHSPMGSRGEPVELSALVEAKKQEQLN